MGLGPNRAVGEGALLALILVDPMCRAGLTGIGDTDVTRVVSYLKVDEILLTCVIVHVTLVNPSTIAKCVVGDEATIISLLLCFRTWFSGHHCTYMLYCFQPGKKELTSIGIRSTIQKAGLGHSSISIRWCKQNVTETRFRSAWSHACRQLPQHPAVTTSHTTSAADR
jgi:hypothetical protein